MPNRRISLATIFALLLTLFAASTAQAAPPNRDPIPPPTDYWQDKGFILMAHQGGEWDFPPNTMFAYKSAIAAGADMIDMDAYVTADNQIVLTHDLEASDNSNAPSGDGYDMNDLTVAQLKEYDFAYKWRPRGSSEDPPYRGIATGEVPPPEGFTAEDFQIPTFGEVLAAFPDTPINIELKQVAGVDIEDTAAEMADLLEAHPGHDENVVINSFGQEMLDAVHAARPEHLSFGGSQDATLGYITGEAITPTPVALEPPDYFNLPPWVRTVPILKEFADYDGYQIYVWGSDHDEGQDTDPFYAQLIAEGADSYNTPAPTRLAEYLCENGVAAPDGSPRCDEQICPEGQEGIAPNCTPIPCPDGLAGTPPDCKPLPVPCPTGTTGTPPNCVPNAVCPAILKYGKGECEIDKTAAVTKVSFAKKKGTVKAGKKIKLTIKVTNSPGMASKATVRLKSSNRQIKVPKSVKVSLPLSYSPRITSKTITVRATGKAKGKAKITATAQGKKGTATLTVKKAKK